MLTPVSASVVPADAEGDEAADLRPDGGGANEEVVPCACVASHIEQKSRSRQSCFW